MALKGLAHFIEVPLLARTQISHDSYLFRFGIPDGQTLGLPVGQHMVFKLLHDGVEVSRKYTPTSKANQVGFFEVPIKVYRPCDKFPEGGKLTQYLEGLKEGDKVQVAGPRGKILYLNKGTFEVDGTILSSSSLAFVCGGTGITPCFQVIQHILEEEKAALDMTLVYANRTEQDILLRSQLDAYAVGGRLKVRYLLEHPPTGWTHSTGLISTSLFREVVRPDALVFHCGPRLMNLAVKAQFAELGFNEGRVNKF